MMRPPWWPHHDFKNRTATKHPAADLRGSQNHNRPKAPPSGARSPSFPLAAIQLSSMPSRALASSCPRLRKPRPSPLPSARVAAGPGQPLPKLRGN